jgi:aspartate kinase
VISRENLHDEERLRRALRERLGGAARLVDGLGAVSAIGAGINATYANVEAGSGALRAIGVTPDALATSSFRITWMIPRDRTADAVRALHDRFVESQPVP